MLSVGLGVIKPFDVGTLSPFLYALPANGDLLTETFLQYYFKRLKSADPAPPVCFSGSLQQYGVAAENEWCKISEMSEGLRISKRTEVCCGGLGEGGGGNYKSGEVCKRFQGVLRPKYLSKFPQCFAVRSIVTYVCTFLSSSRHSCCCCPTSGLRPRRNSRRRWLNRNTNILTCPLFP